MERNPLRATTLFVESSRIRRILIRAAVVSFLATSVAGAQQVAPAPLPSPQYTAWSNDEPADDESATSEQANDGQTQPAAEAAKKDKNEKNSSGNGDDNGLDFLEKDLQEIARTRVTAPAMDAEVTSVMRTPTTVGRSPAAVFVITQEMIRRSGATEVPEVLRMVPGLEVARINASQWSVTSRGFSGRFANKLLVQIDGRSIYNMVFSGVYWEANLVMLQDVERIEVIRGPGASVWGSNAVNGVINIITKSSADTQGGLFFGAAGDELRGWTSLRYGGSAGKDLTWRVYGMFQDQDEGFLPGTQAHDDWRSGQGGFRMDWEPNRQDTITVQGDVYGGDAGGEFREALPVMPWEQMVVGDAQMSGGNVLTRWRRDFDEGDGWALQFYYDRIRRAWPLASGPVDVIDIDFQRQIPWGDRHQIVWGAGYRNHRDAIDNSYTVSFIPPEKTLNVYSCFIQDEITLVEDRLFLTVGSKFEHNDYTGFEYQPTIRALWSLDERRAIWGAVSRAVRTPNRLDRSAYYRAMPVYLGPPPPTWAVILGNDSVRSEELLAWEMGYRAQPTERFSWDVALFFNQYDKLVFTQPTPPMPTPPTWFWPWENCMDGETYGCELSATYQVNPNWKLQTAYTYLRMFLHTDAGFSPMGEVQEGWSPVNQVYFQSSWDLRRDIQFDMMLRYVDALTTLDVPSYVTMDFRLAWCPSKRFEAAWVGRNLLTPSHLEYVRNQGPESQQTEVERAMYGTVTWRF